MKNKALVVEYLYIVLRVDIVWYIIRTYHGKDGDEGKEDCENCRETAAAATLRRLWSYRSRLICIHIGGWLLAIGLCQSISSLPWRMPKELFCFGERMPKELGAFIAFIFASCITRNEYIYIYIYWEGKCTGNLYVDSWHVRKSTNTRFLRHHDYLIFLCMHASHVCTELEFRFNIFRTKFSYKISFNFKL